MCSGVVGWLTWPIRLPNTLLFCVLPLVICKTHSHNSIELGVIKDRVVICFSWLVTSHIGHGLGALGSHAGEA